MQKVVRARPETVHLGATHVQELAIVVGAVGDSDGNLVAVRGNGVVALHEPLPLRRDVDDRLEGAGLGEADDADGLIIDDPRLMQANVGAWPPRKRTDEREAGDTAATAPALGRPAQAAGE